MTIRPNLQERYFDAEGRPTIEGQKLLQSYFDQIEALQFKLDAIAAVVAPTGGATIDTEARDAISNIISGAG